MVKKLKNKRKNFFAGGNVMPSAQGFSKFSLTLDQLTPVGKQITKGFIGKKPKKKII